MGAGQNFAQAASSLALRRGDLAAQRADLEAQRRLIDGRSMLPGIVDSIAGGVGDVMQMMEYDAQKRKAALAEKQKLEEDQAIQDAVTGATVNGKTDWNGVVQTIGTKYPQRALTLQGQISELRKKSADAAKVELDNDRVKIETGIGWFRLVDSPETYAAAYGQLQQADPKLAEMIGPDYTPEKVTAILNMGLSTKDVLEMRSKAIDLFNSGKSDDGLAMGLGSTGSQEEWDAIIGHAVDLGVDPKIVSSFPKEWSAENAEAARRRALTEKEIQDLELRKQTEMRSASTAQRAVEQQQWMRDLQLRQQGERERHNQVMESKGTGPGGGDEVLTRQAAAWRTRELAELETERSKRQSGAVRDALGMPLPPMTPSEYVERKGAIQTLYGEWTGKPPAPGAAPPPPPPAPPTVVNPGAPSGMPIQTRGQGDQAPVQGLRSPELRARAKEILQKAGKDTSDQAIDTFLKNPQNRKALGIR